MNAATIISIVLSAVAIIATIIIAIITNKNAHSKEDKDDAKELQEAVSEIKSVKEMCYGISGDVKGMNQNILCLTREMAKEQANHENLEKRVERIEDELREARMAHG